MVLIADSHHPGGLFYLFKNICGKAEGNKEKSVI